MSNKKIDRFNIVLGPTLDVATSEAGFQILDAAGAALIGSTVSGSTYNISLLMVDSVGGYAGIGSENAELLLPVTSDNGVITFVSANENGDNRDLYTFTPSEEGVAQIEWGKHQDEEHTTTYTAGNIVAVDAAPLPADTSPPVISGIVFEELTATTATVFWDLDEFATGQIEYGLTNAYGSSTNKEVRFIYSAHRQNIVGLSGATTYHYRIISEDEAGNIGTSGDLTFTTEALSSTQGTVESDWAAAAAASAYDEDQPMAGIFVGGSPTPGVYGGANTVIGHHQSIRWRAPRTGLIASFTSQNRRNAVVSVFTRSDARYQEGIDYFASQGDPIINDSSNQDSREKANRIGWMFSNSYSTGNGGSQIFELRNDDNGLPDMLGAPIAVTSNPFIAVQNNSTFYTHTFDSPGAVVAGAFYHTVIRNLTPPLTNNYNSLSAEDMYNMPTDVGRFGLNGIQFPRGPDVANQGGPFLAGHRALRSNDPNTNPANWVVDTDTLPWWGATYTTGEFIGQTQPMFDTLVQNSITGRSGSMHIEGLRRARQALKATHDTTVDGVWVHHSHASSTNGNALLVELKNSAGNVLANSSIPHSQLVADFVQGTHIFEKTGTIWSYQPLSANVDLTANSDYFIEFSAPSGAGFMLMNVAGDSSQNPQTPEYVNNGIKGGAERSEDSGTTWGAYPGSISPFNANRNLQVVLTVQGMPKKLTSDY